MKKKITWQEMLWYIVPAVFVLGGLTLIILGLVGDFLPVLDSKNPIAQASDDFAKAMGGLGFLSWGLIILAVGIIIGVIILSVYASKYDREIEKNSRRAARLGKVKEEAPVVDAEVK